MNRIKTIVLTGYGINCQEELAHAFSLCDCNADIVHIEDLVDGRRVLAHYDILALPGGFSYGDHLGSGKALANRLLHSTLGSGKTLLQEITDFVSGGGYVLGICNGFQVLAKTGLLPGFSGAQEVTLCQNSSGRFEDRWVRLNVHEEVAGGVFSGIESLYLPVRHGEGRFLAGDPGTLRRIQEEDLVVMQYTDSSGRITLEYPENPNGSVDAIAGICDRTGRIIGIMPHPEAFLYAENHPSWTRLKEECGRRNVPLSREGEGISFFRALVRKVEREKGEDLYGSKSTDLCVR